MLFRGRRSTMQPTDAGRESFRTVGEAVLERVRAVARRIAERVRRVSEDTRSEDCPEAPGEQLTSHNAQPRDRRE
jgi:hypothetical protein